MADPLADPGNIEIDFWEGFDFDTDFDTDFDFDFDYDFDSERPVG
ncbi:hypothetical protein [Desulfonatronum thioautotrophicum]|nr:hypothetical protein [Desulfonatronum thioautotrophicum]